MGKAITSWHEDVARYVKGIDNAAYAVLLNNEILEVCRDFCRETDIWSVKLAPIDVVAGVSIYRLSYPGIAMASQVWRVEQAWFKADGEDDDQLAMLEPIVDWREDETGAYWRADTGESPSAYHHLIDSESILLTPIPTVKSDAGLMVTASLIPHESATEVPSILYNRWKRGITHGIASGLMRMSNKPWSDLEMAAAYQVLYLDSRENALESKQRGANRRPSTPTGMAVDRMGIGSRSRGLFQ